MPEVDKVNALKKMLLDNKHAFNSTFLGELLDAIKDIEDVSQYEYVDFDEYGPMPWTTTYKNPDAAQPDTNWHGRRVYTTPWQKI